MPESNAKKTFSAKSTNRINPRISTAAVFLFCALIFAVCLLFFVPRALNNDDRIIHAITAGAFGEYSAVTAHTNVLFAAVLSLLQQALPQTNWFAVTEILLCWLAFSLAGSVTVSNNAGLPGVSLAFVLTVYAAPGFFLNIHNTKLVPVVAASGLISLIYGVSRRRSFFAVTGWMIALIASFIRLNAFLIGAVFAAGAGIAFLIIDERDCGQTRDISDKDNYREESREEEKQGFRGWLKKKLRVIIAVFLFFVTAAGFAVADIVVTNSLTGGKYYREYNEARGMVSDFDMPGYDEFSDEFSVLGISKNDYLLLLEGNMADFEKFDTQTLLEIAKIGKAEASQGLTSRLLKSIVSAFHDIHFLFAAAAALCCMVFGTKKSLITASWSVLALVICLLYLGFAGRVTHWVASGIYGSMLISVVSAARIKSGKTNLKTTIISAVLITAAAAAAVYSYTPLIGNYREGFNRAAGELYTELGKNDENLYLVDTATGLTNEIHRIFPTFSAIPEGYFKNSYTLGGWDTASPAKNSILSRYGINESPYRALIERDNVFLVDTGGYDKKLSFIRENYDPGATMSLVDIIGGYYVFGFTKGAEYFPETGVNRNIIIEETAVSADEILADFVYLGVKLSGRIQNITAAYIKVSDKESKETSYYRARLTDIDGGYAVMTSVELTEVLFPDDCMIGVAFKTHGGFVSTDMVEMIDRTD